MTATKTTDVGELLVPKQSFVVYTGIVRHSFRKDQTVIRAGHPLVVGREHMFKPLTVHYDEDESRVVITQPKPTPRPAAAPRPEKPEPSGFAAARIARAALVHRAKELGIPAKGTNLALEAAIEEAEKAAATAEAKALADAADATEPAEVDGSGSADEADGSGSAD
jgi:hypothetical protein